MGARFQVSRIFRLQGRAMVYLGGTIESGVARIGMMARVHIDGGLYWAIPVISVDCMDVDRAAGISEVVLGLDVGTGLSDLHGNGFDDLRALCHADDVIELVDADGS